MTAVLLALASAALFGGMTVAVRLGLRGVEAGAATLATVIPALGVGLVAAGIRHDLHGVWPFLLAGLLAPGGSQILFTLAVREVGASRTSVTVGGAPLVAVAIAVIFLGEPLGLPLAVGALGVVAGGVLLGAERDRPAHLRAIGFAFAAAGGDALRDPRQPRPRPARARQPGERRRGDAHRGHGRGDPLDEKSPVAARADPAHARRPVLRPQLHLPLRGLLAGTRDRRLAARRDRVAVGRRALGACSSAAPSASGCASRSGPSWWSPAAR